MLDAAQVDKVVADLKREEARRLEGERGALDPELALRLIKDRMDVGRDMEPHGAPSFTFDLSGAAGGLVEAGLAALVSLLKR